MNFLKANILAQTKEGNNTAIERKFFQLSSKLRENSIKNKLQFMEQCNRGSDGQKFDLFLEQQRKINDFFNKRTM